MRLNQAARAFDTLPCSDAYTGALAFYAQLALYDDSKRDSESSERRVLSTSDDVKIPARRVVAVPGYQFIIGHGAPDYHMGKVLRVGWVGHEATQLASVLTLAQACTRSAGRRVWCGRSWVKNSADDQQSSDLVAQYNVFMSSVETMEPGQVLRWGAEVLVVRAVHEGASGLRIGLCDVMPSPSLVDVEITTGTYNKVTETWGGSVQTVPALVARWQSLYAYKDRAAPKFTAADIQVVFAKATVTPVPGQRVTLDSGTWQIESVVDQDDVYICRGVRHA